MCFDCYKVSGTPILELYLPTLSFYMTQIKIIISVVCRETLFGFCVVFVCSLSASDMPVYSSVLLEKFSEH